MLILILVLLACIWILVGSSAVAIAAIVILIGRFFETTKVCPDCLNKTTKEKKSECSPRNVSDNSETPLGEEPSGSVELLNEIDNHIANDNTTAILVSSTCIISPGISVKKPGFITESQMPIAISYSGKERNRVFKITQFLKKHMQPNHGDYSIFFDQDFQHEICRLNGQSHLHDIYRNAKMIVVFLSPTYTDSRYCTGEWRTIVQRFLSNRDNPEEKQLLLVKLGDYDMQKLDLTSADFALNGTRRNNEEIAKIIFQRWEAIQGNN